MQSQTVPFSFSDIAMRLSIMRIKEQFFDALQYGLVVTNPRTYKFEWVNERFAEWCDMTPPEIMSGVSYLDLVKSEEKESLKGIVDSFLDTGNFSGSVKNPIYTTYHTPAGNEVVLEWTESIEDADHKGLTYGVCRLISKKPIE